MWLRGTMMSRVCASATSSTPCEHRELVRRQHAALDEPGQELDDLLAIFDVPATLDEPGPPAGYAGVAWG